jgi:hypothetical protein
MAQKRRPAEKGEEFGYILAEGRVAWEGAGRILPSSPIKGA